MLDPMPVRQRQTSILTGIWPSVCESRRIGCVPMPDSPQLSLSPASAAEGLTELSDNSLQPMLPPTNRGHDRHELTPVHPHREWTDSPFATSLTAAGDRD
ncbi:hypothetical protein ACSS6W_002366 [Trichoderma asperelloides]